MFVAMTDRITEPKLNYVQCPTPAQHQPEGGTHRLAYWEWNQTGDAQHPHVIVCVHGLTRQGRDFDALAQTLSHSARVICPDIVGRGHSDWLQDPSAYAVPQYVSDMLVLLHHLHAQAHIQRLDWVGTSMGGLIGMGIAGAPQLPVPKTIDRLVLNDVGPKLEWEALQRIGAYVGQTTHYATVEEGAAALRTLAPGFGPHTDAQWLALSRPMLHALPQGGFRLHYDPRIAQPLHTLTQTQAAEGEPLLWALYDGIGSRTLLLRGAQSDLLSTETAQRMGQRGPCAACIEFAGVGHAPTLIAQDQVAAVQNFIFG